MNLLDFSRKKSFGTSLILLSVSVMVVGVSILGVTQECTTPAHTTQAQEVCEREPVHVQQVAHTQVRVETAKELGLVFQDHDYTLTLTQGDSHLQVPRLELVSLPGDLAKAGLKDKKTLFLRTHLPLILKTNEQILQDRERLLALLDMQENGFPVRTRDKEWIQDLAKRYGLTKINLSELKKRVDVIPPSLALGQAVVESGWGVSPAARRGNSTFGMMRRSTNKVRAYDSLQECVSDYVRNLNSHPAYKGMRKIRASLRQENDDICSLRLADGLQQYSTRGQSYIREVKQMIQSNGLKRFDGAQLKKSNRSTTNMYS
jgi:Bax protein